MAMRAEFDSESESESDSESDSPGDESLSLPHQQDVVGREPQSVACLCAQLQVLGRVVGPFVQPGHHRTEGQVTGAARWGRDGTLSVAAHAGDLSRACCMSVKLRYKS